MAFDGKITEIWVQFDGEHHTIYAPTVKPGYLTPGVVQAVQVPTGPTWELKVVTTAKWVEQGINYATAVSLEGVLGCIPPISANARMGGGNYTFSFNFPSIVEGLPCTIEAIRFWANRARTNQPPGG